MVLSCLEFNGTQTDAAKRPPLGKKFAETTAELLEVVKVLLHDQLNGIDRILVVSWDRDRVQREQLIHQKTTARREKQCVKPATTAISTAATF